MQRNNSGTGPRKALNQCVRAPRSNRADVEARVASLTPRERQVLHLVVAGKTSKQIAHQLGVSRRTIDVHRRHLMRKMGTMSVIELVRLALLHGVSGEVL